MANPKVSVIMAVRNMGKNVSKTIDSILGQSFKDFEYIIVDDFSEDNTLDVLKEYEGKDKRIILLKNKKWEGKCISRNKALEVAKGEYIAVTDGDDISLLNRFAKEVVYLDSHCDCYLVGARAELQDEYGKKIGESWGLGFDGDISSRLEEGNRYVHSSVMFRNTHEYKYREKFIAAQDYDLFMQMLADGKELHLLNDILVIYTTKRDLVFNEYLLQQKYFAEVAKYLYREKKLNYNDMYEKFDNTDLEKYVPKNIVLEMEMKREFFNGKYKEARKYLNELIDMDPSTEWRIYYIDTFLRGGIRKSGKFVKRLFNR